MTYDIVFTSHEPTIDPMLDRPDYGVPCWNQHALELERILQRNICEMAGKRRWNQRFREMARMCVGSVAALPVGKSIVAGIAKKILTKANKTARSEAIRAAGIYNYRSFGLW